MEGLNMKFDAFSAGVNLYQTADLLYACQCKSGTCER